MENPFAALRPGMRSEHDEIRKGIFSRALYNMQHAPLDERRKWCEAIRATHSAAQAGRRKRAEASPPSSAPALAAPTSSSALAPAPSASPSPSIGVLAPAVGEKRMRAEMHDGDAAVVVGAPRESEVRVVPSQSPPTSLPTETSLATASSETAQVAAATEEELESEASVKECIAAYLRSLLDRVVGVSLENLNIPALRILCTMVGIHTEVRNKIGLYSTLATFYFTECEKLGKRVSRNTVFERQVEQEVAMLKQVTSSSISSATSTKRNGEKRATAAAVVTSASGASSASTSTRSSKASPAAVVVSVTSKRAVEHTSPKSEAKSTAKAGAKALARTGKTAKVEKSDADQHFLKYEYLSDPEVGVTIEEAEAINEFSYSDTLDGSPNGAVEYEDRVFTRRGDRAAAAATSAHMAKYESSVEDDETWSMPMLERKVASIVQLHDPVTVTIVVKKLAQLGYRDGDAESLVEQILQRFHRHGLILYDNGIAYLM